MSLYLQPIMTQDLIKIGNFLEGQEHTRSLTNDIPMVRCLFPFIWNVLNFGIGWYHRMTSPYTTAAPATSTRSR